MVKESSRDKESRENAGVKKTALVNRIRIVKSSSKRAEKASKPIEIRHLVSRKRIPGPALGFLRHKG